MRRVTILGSTGSIGRSTVDLLQRNPEAFSVEALTANRNATRLAEQARAVRRALCRDRRPGPLRSAEEALAGTGIETACGAAALIEAARAAGRWGDGGDRRRSRARADPGGDPARRDRRARQQGGAGLRRQAGHARGRALRRHAAAGRQRAQCDLAVLRLRPGRKDREDHADLQRRPVSRAHDRGDAEATPEQAVAHPNWSMGAKISVDSATLMNKGLELIEAHHLFGMPADRIDIVVHPQSVVHSLVSYCDGSVLAQLGSPDMRTPIAYALAWPERIAAPTKRLDLAAVGASDIRAARCGAVSGVARGARSAGGGRRRAHGAERRQRDGGPRLSRSAGSAFSTSPRRSSARSPRSPRARLNSLEDVYNFDKAARRRSRRILRRFCAGTRFRANGAGMIHLSSLEALGHGALQYGGSFLIVLTVLVFVHEFGHYLVARWNGVRVEVFSIGFGPELFGWRDRAGTRWKFSAIPLGGYVKMFGDGDPASGCRRSVSPISHRPSARSRSMASGSASGRRSSPPARRRISCLPIAVLAMLFATYGQPFTPARGRPGAAGQRRRAGRHAAGRRDRAASTADRSSASRTFSRSSGSIPATPMTIVVRRGGGDLTLHVTPQA